MGSRGRAIVAFSICAAVIAYVVSRDEEHEDAREPATRIVREQEVRDAAVPAPIEEPRAPEQAIEAAHVPEGEVDPCSNPEDDSPVVRPSLSELLRLRIAELNDRMIAIQRSGHASPELSRAWSMVVSGDPSSRDEALRAIASAPDRVSGGFDAYVAIALVMATSAPDDRTAIRLAQSASQSAPNDPLPLLVEAISRLNTEERARARELFTRAFQLDPEEPAIALALTQQGRNGPDLSTILAAYDAYLEAVPADRGMRRERARLALRSSAIAGGTVTTRRGLTILGHPSLTQSAALHVLDVVDAGLTRGAALLGVPRRDELTIIVFPDVTSMHRATCVQGWAGAVFDGALETDATTIASPTGDRSLTHESFHAAMHPSVPNVPLWLDEGLAQYVAGEEGMAHAQSYALMVREHTWIPFASMNDAFLEIEDSRDAGLAYHQALAMVEWLVDRRGERGVRDAAAWLVGGGDPNRVLAEAARAELDGDTLLAFVARRLAAIQNEARAPSPR